MIHKSGGVYNFLLIFWLEKKKEKKREISKLDTWPRGNKYVEELVFGQIKNEVGIK